MLPKLAEMGTMDGTADPTANQQEETYKSVNEYLAPALEIYFSGLGVDPFGEVEK